MFWHDTDYHFFDYKYNIADYHGQDYDGPARWIYLAGTLILITILLILFRKATKKQVKVYLIVAAIAMTSLEVAKVTWESIWDVQTGRGFNVEGILPLYTCSMFMYCAIAAVLTKGKAQRYPLAWLSTIGIVGGMSNVLFIQGLKWYPFWTFGAMHSMTYHAVMVFTGLFIITTGYFKVEWKDILRAFLVQLAASLIVIPIDYIKHWDYMQYYEAGGVPVIEDLSDKLWNNGCGFVTAIIMTAIYAAFCGIFVSIYKLCYFLKGKIQRKEQIA